MIILTQDFVRVVYSIIKIWFADTESKMMCIEGLMQGHGVTWKQVNLVLIESVTDAEYPALKAELGPFVSMRDYFIYQVNSGNTSHFARLCSRCMDFTLMEAGNRVNLAENNGPY